MRKLKRNVAKKENAVRRKVAARKAMQYRAENLKGLHEQRVALVQEMKDLAETAETEKRAMSEEEDARFDELEAQVQALDKTIEKMERARNLKLDNKDDGQHRDEDGQEDKEKLEERAFENYIRRACGIAELETRAGEQNLTMGNNGAIIPSTIANRIITTVKDICPILQKAVMYQVKGTLLVPVWGLANGTHDITVSYHEEFTELTADTGKFTSISLEGYLVGALVLIGKSLVNNAQIDVVSFVVAEMAKKIAEFMERELLIGTTDKASGALTTTNVKETAASTVITADELVILQSGIKQVYQKDACWVMHPETFASIKLLKDGNNRYLLQDDYTSEFPYRLLGKPVYLSDNMPKMAAGAKAILYGDLSGLSVNMRENVQIQVLNEKYATQHAVGIVAWFEFDSKVTEHEKLITLQMKDV